MKTLFSRGKNEPAMSIIDIEEISINDIPKKYVAVKDGVYLLSTGKIRQFMEGCACPMGSLTREFLKKLKIEENVIMLVDVEAGIEHFGRGVEAGIDVVIVVVEPSLESITLAGKIRNLTSSSGAVFYGAILNKVSSDSQIEYMVEKLKEINIKLIGAIRFHNEIQLSGLKGLPVPDQVAPVEIANVVDEFLRSEKVKGV